MAFVPSDDCSEKIALWPGSHPARAKSLGDMIVKLTVMGLFVLPLVGCATTSVRTTQRSDLWDSRVGHYTYSQMVLKHGKPISQETLSNGDMAATWSRGNGMTGDGSIRLVFDGNEVLDSWSYFPR
jgi:hypothetical protein